MTICIVAMTMRRYSGVSAALRLPEMRGAGGEERRALADSIGLRRWGGGGGGGAGLRQEEVELRRLRGPQGSVAGPSSLLLLSFLARVYPAVILSSPRSRGDGGGAELGGVSRVGGSEVRQCLLVVLLGGVKYLWLEDGERKRRTK